MPEQPKFEPPSLNRTKRSPGSVSGGPMIGSRAVGLLLPILLTFFPLLLLTYESREFQHRQQMELEVAWVEAAGSAGERLAKDVQPGALLEKTSRRIRRVILEKPGLPSSEIVQGQIKKMWDKAPVKPLVWFAGVANNQKDFSDLQLSRDKGFNHNFRYVFRTLFQQVLIAETGQSSQLGTKGWVQRLKATFGETVSPELFLPQSRGKPFYAVFNRKQGLLVWNTVLSDSGACKVFLLFLPHHRGCRAYGLANAIRNWHVEKPEDALWPAFLPLPTQVPSHARAPFPESHKTLTGECFGGPLLHPTFCTLS